MKTLLDTNVLVAAVSGRHTHHAQAFPLLEREQQRQDEGFVSAHSRIVATPSSPVCPFAPGPPSKLVEVRRCQGPMRAANGVEQQFHQLLRVPFGGVLFGAEFPP